WRHCKIDVTVRTCGHPGNFRRFSSSYWSFHPSHCISCIRGNGSRIFSGSLSQESLANDKYGRYTSALLFYLALFLSSRCRAVERGCKIEKVKITCLGENSLR